MEQQVYHSADSLGLDARNTANLINNLSTKISERTNRFNDHFNSNIKSKVNHHCMQTAPGTVLTPAPIGLTTQSAETPRKLLPLKRIWHQQEQWRTLDHTHWRCKYIWSLMCILQLYILATHSVTLTQWHLYCPSWPLNQTLNSTSKQWQYHFDLLCLRQQTKRIRLCKYFVIFGFDFIIWTKMYTMYIQRKKEINRWNIQKQKKTVQSWSRREMKK